MEGGGGKKKKNKPVNMLSQSAIASSDVVKEVKKKREGGVELKKNKAGYTATELACGWAGGILNKAAEAFGRSSNAK